MAISKWRKSTRKFCKKVKNKKLLINREKKSDEETEELEPEEESKENYQDPFEYFIK